MLEVKIDNIVPVTEARDSFNQLVDKVEGSDDMFVLTKNGKPSAILVGVHHLEKLTGTSHEELLAEVTTPAPAQEATPAESLVAEPVAETPVEAPAPEVTPTEPMTTPVAPQSTPASPTDDTMENLQDSPFAFDDTASAAAPTQSTPPVSPTPEQPVDNAPLPGQDSQNNTPQTPLSDNNPL